MQITLCKSKLHDVVVKQTNLEYHGSITIDRDLMEAARLVPFERVQVANLTNGNRLETYVIEGERGSGMIALNGACAHQFSVGEKALVISYAMVSEEESKDWHPVVVFVDENNSISETLNY